MPAASQAAQRIRAVFVDLDGTLLNRQHQVSEYTAKVLRSLKQRYRDDVAFVVATGRPFNYVIEQIENNKLPVDYIITSNGCRIHRGGDLSVVSAHDIPPGVVKSLFDVNVERENRSRAAEVKQAIRTDTQETKKDDLTVESMSSNIFTGDHWYTNYKIQGLGNSYPAHMQPRLLPDDILECLQVTNPLSPVNSVSEAARTEASAKLNSFFSDVHMMFFYGPHENLLPVERILQTDPSLSSQVSFSFSLPHIIDVYPAGVDKSFAVRKVCEKLGVSLDEAIAFGDGQNDVTMLKAVGKAFVMANGQQRVKDAVPEAELIGTNEEDSVARKLDELFELEETHPA